MTSVEKQQKYFPHERSEASIAGHSALNDQVKSTISSNMRVFIILIILAVLLATSIAFNGYLGWKAYQLKDISVSRRMVSYSLNCSA